MGAQKLVRRLVSPEVRPWFDAMCVEARYVPDRSARLAWLSSGLRFAAIGTLQRLSWQASARVATLLLAAFAFWLAINGYEGLKLDDDVYFASALSLTAVSLLSDTIYRRVRMPIRRR